MKFLKPMKHLAILVVPFVLFAACNNFNGPQPIDSGDADLSKYVAVGNSVTAGFQSSALYESAQEYSFPNILANQIGIQNFEQPLISDPGIGGRIGLVGLNPTQTNQTTQQGQPLNANLSRPYDNLGIPGAILADFLGQDLPGNTYANRRASNPFYNLILRNQGADQATQLTALKPTLVTFWLGNNDVLGYVTSGGHRPYVPATAFQQLYTASAGALAGLNATVATINIPDVTSLPFVFLVNSTLISDGTLTVNSTNGVIQLAAAGDAPLWIQRTDPNNPGAIRDTVMMKAPIQQLGFPGDFFLLSAQSQLPSLFNTGVGLSKSNPIPSPLVLDSGELTQALTLIAQYNQSIATISGNNGFTMVDINDVFSDAVSNFQASGGQDGVTTFDITLRPVPGELFSFDGVHPSNRAHGIIANEVIKALNSNVDSQIPLVDIREIPEGLPVNAGL